MYQLSIADYLEETREIPLSQGKVAIVSASDFDWLMQWKWCALHRKYDDRWYVVRSDREGETIYMHRFIMQPPPSKVVDHADGDGLNNTRSNLRICTQSQNQRNRKKHRNSNSQYKGVFRSANRAKWVSVIYSDGKNRHLGTFNTEIEAAKAFDAVASKFFGEFARLNFPQEPLS